VESVVPRVPFWVGGGAAQDGADGLGPHGTRAPPPDGRPPLRTGHLAVMGEAVVEAAKSNKI
jgi:hypothetical protein